MGCQPCNGHTYSAKLNFNVKVLVLYSLVGLSVLYCELFGGRSCCSGPQHFNQLRGATGLVDLQGWIVPEECYGDTYRPS